MAFTSSTSNKQNVAHLHSAAAGNTLNTKICDNTRESWMHKQRPHRCLNYCVRIAPVSTHCSQPCVCAFETIIYQQKIITVTARQHVIDVSPSERFLRRWFNKVTPMWQDENAFYRSFVYISLRYLPSRKNITEMADPSIFCLFSIRRNGFAAKSKHMLVENIMIGRSCIPSPASHSQTSTSHTPSFVQPDIRSPYLSQ